MQFLIVALIVFSLPLFAEENYLSDQLEKEIESSDFSVVDELTENEKVIEDLSLREQYFKERKRPWSPVPFRALLQKGTRLLDIKTGKVYFTSSDIYAWAQEETIGSQVSYILNQERVAKYKTFTRNLQSIERDVTLYPQIDPNKSYLDKPKHHSTDQILKIENHLSFHIESMTNNFFAEIYDGVETTSTANRFQLKSYYNSHLPIDFGISFGYQEGIWNETDNRVKWTTGYFGPSLRWQFAKWGKLHFNTKLGVERSFRFKAIGANSDTNFSSLLYEWELEGVYYSGWGPILVGFTYRNMNWMLEDTDTVGGFNDNEGNVVSTSLFAGYRIDFDF